MYIHLGADTVLRDDAVIGIFDLDTASVSANTRDFLKKAQQGGRVREVTPELPRSFAVCVRDGETAVYLSQLSTATLKKRIDTFDK